MQIRTDCHARGEKATKFPPAIKRKQGVLTRGRLSTSSPRYATRGRVDSPVSPPCFDKLSTSLLHVLHLLGFILLLVFVHAQRVVFHFVLEHFVHHPRDGMRRCHRRLRGHFQVFLWLLVYTWPVEGFTPCQRPRGSITPKDTLTPRPKQVHSNANRWAASTHLCCIKLLSSRITQ